MNVAIIGANGIGSYLLRGLDEAIEKDCISLNRGNVTIFDDDHVENKNTRYALYTKRDIGGKKAIIAGRRYGFNFKTERVTDVKQLNGFDVIIMAADNNTVRRLVQGSGKSFIDMRAEGRQVLVFDMTEDGNEEDYLKLTPESDREGSCQREEDLANGTIQMGNRIAAEVGLQKLVSFIREEDRGSWKHILNV